MGTRRRGGAAAATESPPDGDQRFCARASTFRNHTESDLDAIEELAKANESETYRGPLLALVGEVRRLREVARGREVASGN